MGFYSRRTKYVNVCDVKGVVGRRGDRGSVCQGGGVRGWERRLSFFHASVLPVVALFEKVVRCGEEQCYLCLKMRLSLVGHEPTMSNEHG